MSAKQWKPDKDATHVYVQSCQVSSHLSKEQKYFKRGGGDNGSSQAIYGANSPVFVGLAKELFELLRSTFC